MISQFPAPGESVEAIDERNPYTCPECARDDRTAKVASVVRQQSGLIYSSAGAREPQAYVSGLARQLSLQEPVQGPSPASVMLSIILSWIAGAVLLAPFIVLQQQDLIDLPSAPLNAGVLATLGWFGLAMPAILIISAMLTYERSRRQIPAWHSMSARWHQLYYCSRDDVVFLPGSEEAVLPEDMVELLSRRVMAENAVEADAHNHNGASI